MSDLRIFPPVIDDSGVPDDLLAQYASGECTNAEREWIEAWAATSPERAAILQAVLLAWGMSGTAPATQSVNTDLLLQQLRGRAAVVERSIVKHSPTFPSVLTRPNSTRFWKLGAGLGLAATLIFAIAVGTRPELQSPPAGLQHAQSPDRQFKTTNGQRAAIQLTDGSRVILGVASHLQYTEDLATGARIAHLTGEAYFDIAPNTSRPFLVIVDSITTRVLGTRFGVRKYPEDPELRVAVLNGRVMLDNAVLDANMVGRRTTTGVHVTHNTDVTRLMGWTDGRLEFYDRPFREVLVELSRWYDFEFSYEGRALGDERITTTFTTASVDDVAQAFVQSLNIEYRRTGRSITFIQPSGVRENR